MMGPTIVLWLFIKSIMRVFELKRESVWLFSSLSCFQHWDSDLLDHVGGFMWQRTAEAFEGEFILRNEGNMKTDLLY